MDSDPKRTASHENGDAQLRPALTTIARKRPVPRSRNGYAHSIAFDAAATGDRDSEDQSGIAGGMVGTTRSRVSFFMNRFRKMGFIDYDGDIKVHSSLLNVVLHD